MVRWPTKTLYQGIRDVANEAGDSSALIIEDSTITYSELLERGRSFAHGLAELGVSKGDTIAVWLGNRPEWITTQIAASYLGAAIVAVNTRYRRHELEYMLNDSGASVVVTEHSFLGTDYLEMLSEIVPSIKDTSPDTFDPDDVEALADVISLSSSNTYSAVRGFDAVRENGAANLALDPITDPEQPVVIFYTSGTTGEPKGCLHSSHSVLNHSFEVGEHYELASDDVGITLMPFCGIMGYNYFLSILTHGATAVVQPYFKADQVAENIKTHNVTYLSGTDEMFTRLIDSDLFSAHVAKSLRKGAAFFANGYDEETFDRIEDTVGYPIVQPYGLSEANSQIFVGNPADSKDQRKRVGGPLIHPEEENARIIDPETGEELPVGERGELQLKGYNVLQQYHDKPKKTAEDIVDGWLHTGDLCEQDENGYFYYHSRIDDALRVRGFLVSPRDIERAIDDYTAVEQSQVVGAAHPRHGEVPVAFVKVNEEVNTEEIESYLTTQIADYKRPEDIIIIKEFPRAEGPHGEKIQKNKLRERVAGQYKEAGLR